MAGWFAYAALLAWPMVAVVLFRTMPRAEALIWTILGGYLLLPVATHLDAPLLPPLDKSTGPALAALAILALYAPGDGPRGWLPESPVARVLVVAFLAVPLITAGLNAAPVLMGGRQLQGMTWYDGASLSLEHLMAVVPLLLGRRYLASAEAHRAMLVAFALGGLAYALPILIEIRLSPQLHAWIYGFFPHAFDQQIRSGGFRPVVFLGHGILVAGFVAAALVAALALWRGTEGSRRQAWIALAGGLAVLLVLCKTLGALVLGLAGGVLVALGGHGMVRLAALCMAITVLAYPALRASGTMPVSSIVAMVEQIRPERAQSLQFRLDNEDILLDRAALRPAFGWGGWDRNRVFDAWGNDITTTDGRWIITLGRFGWTGYLAEFGLLTLGLILLAGPLGRSMPFASGALAVVLAINLVDLVPNASLTPLSWLIAGALLGAAEARQRTRSSTSSTSLGSDQGARRRSNSGAITRRAPARLR